MATERKPYPCEHAWGTKQELNYINTIGEALNKREGREEGTCVQYLKGYINSCKKRINWGSGSNKIDKYLCLKRAQELLGALRNGY